jgi:Ca-activated chloride channel family protein
MWGKVEGKEKIVVAREVMANLINELPEGTQVGLEAYGHRAKGDCNDIEMMVPVGASDKSAVIDQINAINPKGKTPITQSFEVAGERLKGVEEETTVVLISDGKETCAGDPGALPMRSGHQCARACRRIRCEPGRARLARLYRRGR